MDIQEYQSEYRAKVLQLLTDYAREKGYGSVRLLETDDLDEIAPVLLRAYFADSVPDFAQYPAVSLELLRRRRARGPMGQRLGEVWGGSRAALPDDTRRARLG